MGKAKDQEPKLIESERSGPFERDGHLVEAHIYKLEHDKDWVLEVVDENGTSTVWDDKFRTDRIAWKEFLRTIEKEGMAAVRDACHNHRSPGSDRSRSRAVQRSWL